MAGSAECPFKVDWMTTKSEVTKFDYRWEIPDFANKVSEGWTRIDGPVISAEGTQVYWMLGMVPNSNGFLCVEVKQCRISCNHSFIIEDGKTQMSLKCCVLKVYEEDIESDDDDENDEFYAKFTQVPLHFKPVGMGHRWRLMQRAVVLGDRVHYLPHGKLTVLCTIRYLEPNAFVADRLKEPSLVVPPSDIASFMKNVFTEARFSDVDVVCGERTFPVHRAILAERSDVFRAMFDVNMSEKHDRRVEITDMNPDALNDLLTFIYTDSAPNMWMNVEELLAAAEKYNIPRLKEICEQEMASSLDMDSVIERLIESDLYKADQLKKAALHWIAKHAPEVVKTESWDSLCKEHPGLVKEISEQLANYIGQFK